MPFKSKKQNSWAHTSSGTKALGGKKNVKEWESATNYKNLPTKVTHGVHGSVKGSAKGSAKGGIRGGLAGSPGLSNARAAFDKMKKKSNKK